MFEKKKNYDLMVYNNEVFRVYNTSKLLPFDMFYQEFEVFVDVLKDENHFFYIFNYEPNNNIELTESDKKYLQLHEDENYKLKNNQIPENINLIKFFQLHDLCYFEKLENLDFYLYIPRLNENNLFYYDLIFCFNKKIDENIIKLINIKSSLVKFKNYIYLNEFNYNFDFFKSFINIESNIFKNYSFTKMEFEELRKFKKDLENWPENIAYGKFVFSSKVRSEKIEDIEEGKYLHDKYYERLNSSDNVVLRKKIIYQCLCIQFNQFNIGWQNVKGEIYLRKEFSPIVEFYGLSDLIKLKEVNKKHVIEIEPNFYSIFDLMTSNQELLCINNCEIRKNYLKITLKEMIDYKY